MRHEFAVKVEFVRFSRSKSEDRDTPPGQHSRAVAARRVDHRHCSPVGTLMGSADRACDGHIFGTLKLLGARCLWRAWFAPASSRERMDLAYAGSHHSGGIFRECRGRVAPWQRPERARSHRRAAGRRRERPSPARRRAYGSDRRSRPWIFFTAASGPMLGRFGPVRVCARARALMRTRPPRRGKARSD